MNKEEKKIFVSKYTPGNEISKLAENESFDIKEKEEFCRTHETKLVYGQCPVCMSVVRTMSDNRFE